MAGAVALASLAACSGGAEEEPLGESAEAQKGDIAGGKQLFESALQGSNGRSCATCHSAADHLALNAASAEARYQADPTDPLFNPIDADDPAASPPTFNHLRNGLVRVTLSLAANLDVIDDSGAVITNANRTITVWRGVPTVENTAITGPYLSDGRAATLKSQAIGAIEGHSQVGSAPPPSVMTKIADYEASVASSSGMGALIDAMTHDNGHGNDTLPDPDPSFAQGSPEAAGKAVFQMACAACHGGATGNTITNRAAADTLFVTLNADGSIKLAAQSNGSLAPVPLTNHANGNYLNIGVSGAAYRRQVASPPDPLSMPHYRLRFYTDATRTTKVVDLPPPPVDPVSGQPVLGPNRFAQAFTVDPGRAVLSGDPADFEAFDVPQLRGIKNTAPYMHDNSKPTLQNVVDFYSRFLIPRLPAMGLPAVSQGPGLPAEALSATQKTQLIAYLNAI